VRIVPRGERFVASATEVDLRAASDADVAAFRDALFRYKVVVAPGQALSAAEYHAFMSRLGAPVPHVLAQFSLPALRDVLVVSNVYGDDGEPIGVHEGGAYWHADMSYLAANTVLTSLYALESPSEGGRTHFVDCAVDVDEAEFAALLRELGLGESASVLHRFGNRARRRDERAAFQRLDDDQTAKLPEVRHPLLQRHPYAGTHALYAVAGTAIALDERSEAESLPLLDALEAWLLERRARYAHSYEPGDLVVWDNLSALHSGEIIAPADGPGTRRLLLRMNADYSRRAAPA
jgi:taurine dioxygenase